MKDNTHTNEEGCLQFDRKKKTYMQYLLEGKRHFQVIQLLICYRLLVDNC